MNSKIKNKIRKKINKKKRRITKTRRIVQRVIKKKFKRRSRGRMAAAYIKNFKRMFNVLRQTGTSMRVKGKDLIYKIPDSLSLNNSSNVIAIIPSNPAYWIGTRMAAISAGYQNYRPIKFNIVYVPQCAVTQQGNVLAGTLWTMSPNTDNLQQTLRTSNGGMLTQCYKGAKSTVELGSNLQFNLFRMGGKFDQESNPFIFIALAIATVDSNNNKINPGYFYVEYEYELKNPIGDTIKYFNSGLIENEFAPTTFINNTLINCSSTKANVGAIIQKDNESYTWNEQNVTIVDEDLVWYFSNQIDEAVTKTTVINFNDEDLSTENTKSVEPNEIVYILLELSTGYCYLLEYANISASTVNVTLSSVALYFQGTRYWLVDSTIGTNILEAHDMQLIYSNSGTIEQKVYIPGEKLVLIHTSEQQ